jgi:hypothetical protein
MVSEARKYRTKKQTYLLVFVQLSYGIIHKSPDDVALREEERGTVTSISNLTNCAEPLYIFPDVHHAHGRRMPFIFRFRT